MTLTKWVLLCCILALPCAGLGSLLIYLGGPDADSVSDRDGDGLLDAWEQEHFGHLDFSADDDPDLDGVANEAELARGTRPDDASSATVTLFVSRSAGQLSYDGLARQWDGSHGPKPTISTALFSSLSGDTIHVLSGTYLEDVTISGMNVTVTGEGLIKGTP
ncbi:MAG: hypothetical protein QGH42_12555 [Kiritimatiellia bacterium]|nr:hypothetical protein [Kiritimatiellia bacterium]MDP6630509.1 hypothetical protein [Kiritimatiellia bacterium]MDP6809966.1 hypothetical protein [Kiritimatiellia bacterium]MDP7025056.1 hypothetical protein [Kiritimatiellia bacterium]